MASAIVCLDSLLKTYLLINVMIDSKLVDFQTRLVGSGSQTNPPGLTNGIMMVTGCICGWLCVFLCTYFHRCCWGQGLRPLLLVSHEEIVPSIIQVSIGTQEMSFKLPCLYFTHDGRGGKWDKSQMSPQADRKRIRERQTSI